VPGLLAFWLLSAPRPLLSSDLPQHVGDPENGKLMYTIGGCRACHKPDKVEAGADPDLPSGGAPLKTPVGVLYPPNLTPDPASGIGVWSDLDFVNAVQRGIAPDGRHLIPAFPYTSYAAMRTADVLDIKAYLMTLKPVAAANKPQGLPFAPVLRRGIGLWKWLGLDTTPWRPDPARSASWNRGSYLVNGPGHCGECHTPRNILMIRDDGRALAGGAHPSGEGKVPSLRDLIGRKRYKDADDLALALANGEMLGYGHLSSGGMGEVQANLALLPDDDVKAIATYLTSLK
jgi:mono/diheme cytochrome c family protein